MGKYNFANQQIADLNAKIEELTKRLNHEALENAELRAAVTTLSKALESKQAVCNERSIINSLSPETRQKANELCGIDVNEQGEVFKTNDLTHINKRFKNLLDNISKLLVPTAYKPPETNKTRNYLIAPPALHSLTDKEYEVMIDTMSAIVDTMHYARKQMEGLSNDNM